MGDWLGNNQSSQYLLNRVGPVKLKGGRVFLVKERKEKIGRGWSGKLSFDVRTEVLQKKRSHLQTRMKLFIGWAPPQIWGGEKATSADLGTED